MSVKVDLPFSVDRSSRVKFPQQVADGLREAIADGFWKPGDRLPTYREMHVALGVSARAPLEAFRMLANEGLITLCTRTGAVVNKVRSSLKNGRILLVMSGAGTLPADALLCHRIRMGLNAAGYMVTISPVVRDGDGEVDLRQLKSDLCRTLELVVVPGNQPQAIRMVEESGCPFLVYGGRAVRSRMCVGAVSPGTGPVVRAFVAHLKRAGVRRLMMVCKSQTDGMWLEEVLRSRRISTSRMVISVPRGPERVAALMRTAMERFDAEFVRRGRAWLPRLLFFTDDYVFMGAYVAMLRNGVRLPEDVSVVSEANFGSVPPVPGGLTRIEFNALKFGDELAAAILGYLRTGAVPRGLVGFPTYVIGSTFPG